MVVVSKFKSLQILIVLIRVECAKASPRKDVQSFLAIHKIFLCFDSEKKYVELL